MRKSKKILCLDYTLPYLYSDLDKYPGGAAVEWYHWIKGFKENNIKIGILTLKGAKNYITKELDFDLVESWDIKKGIPKLKLFYYVIPSIYKAIKNYNPDYLVQETASRNTAIMAIISKILHKKFIHRIGSDQDVDQRIKEKLSKFNSITYNLGLKLADIIFCQNQYQVKMLKKKFPNKKIFLIYNPYNIANNKKILGKSDRSFIAWIGSFTYLKNIPALLKVIKKNSNLKFKIVGKHVENNVDMATDLAIKELKKIKNVEFVGFLKNEEIPGFLSGAYALLNTSWLEGFSNTFIEAWSVGTPVISTKNVNPDNIISNFELGILTDSYEDLPNALTQIISMSNDEYHDLSLRCINYVKENHDPETLAAKFLDYINT